MQEPWVHCPATANIFTLPYFLYFCLKTSQVSLCHTTWYKFSDMSWLTYLLYVLQRREQASLQSTLVQWWFPLQYQQWLLETNQVVLWEERYNFSIPCHLSRGLTCHGSPVSGINPVSMLSSCSLHVSPCLLLSKAITIVSFLSPFPPSFSFSILFLFLLFYCFPPSFLSIHRRVARFTGAVPL